MKICSLCQREYEDDLFPGTSPAEEIGSLFLKSCTKDKEESLCLECKENAGIITLLGFGQ